MQSTRSSVALMRVCVSVCPENKFRTKWPLIYTVSQKTSHHWLAIPLTHVNGFWYFFGRNVTDKKSNQKTLYYATSNNLCFCTTWQNEKTRKSHFHSNAVLVESTAAVGLCCTHNVVFLKEKYLSFIKMHKGRLTTYNASRANKINVV